MDDQEEQSTCGRGLAASAVVPSALAAVAAGLAQNLEVHTRALDPDDPAAGRRRGLRRHRARSPERRRRPAAAAEEMDAAVDLPMGAHDMAAMTTTDVLDAFERHVAAEDDLLRVLEARRADNEQMLTMIRAAIGGPGSVATYPKDATGSPKTPSSGTMPRPAGR